VLVETAGHLQRYRLDSVKLTASGNHSELSPRFVLVTFERSMADSLNRQEPDTLLPPTSRQNFKDMMGTENADGSVLRATDARRSLFRDCAEISWLMNIENYGDNSRGACPLRQQTEFGSPRPSKGSCEKIENRFVSATSVRRSARSTQVERALRARFSAVDSEP